MTIIKTTALIGGLFLALIIRAQDFENRLISITDAPNDTIEIGKEYLIIFLHDGKTELKAAGCDVKLVVKEGKYYITTGSKGEFMIFLWRNGKVIAAPYKFYSVKKID